MNKFSTDGTVIIKNIDIEKAFRSFDDNSFGLMMKWACITSKQENKKIRVL